MSTRHPTPDQVRIVTELFKAGKSDVEIGQALGLGWRAAAHMRQVLKMLRPNAGLTAGNQHKAIDREFVAREFRERNRPSADLTQILTNIAELIGAHRDSVRRVLREDGLIDHRIRVAPSEEAIAQADEMLDGTIPYSEVAATTGIKEDWLEHHMPRRGLRPQFLGVYRTAKRMADELL